MESALVISLDLVKLEEAMNLPDDVFILRVDQNFEDTVVNRIRIALAGPGLKPNNEWPQVNQQAKNEDFDGVDVSTMLAPYLKMPQTVIK